MKKQKKLFILLISTLLIIGTFWFVISFFKSSEKNLEKTTSEVFLNSNDLVANFLSNKTKANNLYVGKVIEITGYVDKVTFLNNRKTVLLFTENKESGVICDVNEDQTEKIKQLKKNQKITIKGICKGFLKDVILLNCYIDLKPNE